MYCCIIRNCHSVIWLEASNCFCKLWWKKKILCAPPVIYRVRVRENTCLAGMSSLSFSSACSQVVKGRDRDKCQRQHATVITTILQRHTARHVFSVNDRMWTFVYTLCMPAHTSALWAFYMWMFVFGCLGALFFAHLAFQAHSCKVEVLAHIRCWAGSGGRGVKVSGAARSRHHFTSWCTPPLLCLAVTHPQSCVFFLVWFCFWLWGGVSVSNCVIQNVKIDLWGAPHQKNKPSFFSP